ncbi:hypothetical protein A3B46_01045 [Candidatus Roizmanbacteria bacterium RIFCSPLOWO2_01_FULL_39_19]|nr:MAG: hypothetical protein A3B46_01045 [Candidatus Roizmanbacteria bacterium RIFCSPLOWO2_01_FULL_39_19]
MALERERGKSTSQRPAQKDRGGDRSFDPAEFGLPPEVRILEQQDERLLLCEVPLSLVDRGEVAVDEKIITDTARLMDEEPRNRRYNGQITPVYLVQVIDNSNITAPSIFLCDGYHRTEIQERKGSEFIYGTIALGYTLENAIDLRISLAMHQSVDFARIVEWASDAWSLTPWAKEGIHIGTAFALVASPNVTGARLKKSPEEVEEIKRWIMTKCDRWHRKPEVIYQSLNYSNKASSDLIRITRGRPTAPDGISHKDFRLIRDAAEFNYDLQMKMARVIMSGNLSAWEVETFASAIKRANTEEIDALLQGGWRQRRPQPTRPAATTYYAPTSQAAPAEQIAAPATTQDEPLQRPMGTPTTPRSLAAIEDIRQLEQLVSREVLERMWHLLSENTRLTVENAILTGRIPWEMPDVSNETDALSPDEPVEETPKAKGEGKLRVPSLSDYDTRQIVDAAQKGDLGLFDSYFSTVLSRRLYKYVYYRIGTSFRHIDPEDLVQELYMRISQGILKKDFVVRFPSSLDAFAFACASNLITDHFRRQPSDDLELKETISDRRLHDLFEGAEVGSFQHSSLHNAILLLTPDQREVVMLRYFSSFDLDNPDVALVMGKEEGAIKSLLFRAKARIARMLEL